jgi:hypothetical protein
MFKCLELRKKLQNAGVLRFIMHDADENQFGTIRWVGPLNGDFFND